MKNLKNSIYLIGALCVCAVLMFGNVCHAEDEAITVSAVVDKDEIAIGDRVTYTITVETAKDTEIQLPEFGENLAGFAVKDFGKKEKSWLGKKTIKQWFLLDTYITGSYEIPPAVVRYKTVNMTDWEEIETDAVKVEVKSLMLTEGVNDDIKDIKGPVSYPLNKWIVISAAVILLVILAIVITIFTRKKILRINVAPPRPAHEIAYEALEALRKKELSDQEHVKAFFSELSFIVRQYIENRFNIRAPEMTTEEFLISIKNTQVLKYDHASLVRDFLTRSDMVKFAKYGPNHDEIEASFISAKTLIDQTRESAEAIMHEAQKDDL